MILRLTGDFSDDAPSLIHSEKFCGYLRHLESGTCVTMDSVGRLIAHKNFPCDYGSKDLASYPVFCYNSKTDLISLGFDEDRRDPDVAVNLSTNDILIPISQTYKIAQWYPKMNGRIQLKPQKSNSCWERSETTGSITLENCTMKRSSEDLTLQQQQFDFQLPHETSGARSLKQSRTIKI